MANTNEFPDGGGGKKKQHTGAVFSSCDSLLPNSNLFRPTPNELTFLSRASLTRRSSRDYARPPFALPSHTFFFGGGGFFE